MCQNYFLSLKNEEGDYFSFEICLVLLEQSSQMTTEWSQKRSPVVRALHLHKPTTLKLSLSNAPQEHSCAPPWEMVQKSAKDNLESPGTSGKAQHTRQHSFKNSFFSDRWL